MGQPVNTPQGHACLPPHPVLSEASVSLSTLCKAKGNMPGNGQLGNWDDFRLPPPSSVCPSQGRGKRRCFREPTNGSPFLSSFFRGQLEKLNKIVIVQLLSHV